MNAQAAPRPRARGTFDASRAVVAVLAFGVLLSLVSFLLPSGAGSHPAATFTEGKVFEGRKYKYHLRAPPGGVWRITPEILLPPMPVEADLTIDHPGSETRVMVFASPMVEKQSLDEIMASITAGQEGSAFEEIERTPIQRGADQGIYIRGRRPVGRRSVAMQALVLTRDNIVYVVTGVAPEPVPDSLAAQMSALIKSFEPPPPQAGGAPVLVTGSPGLNTWGSGSPAASSAPNPTVVVPGTAAPLAPSPTALPLK